MSAFESERLWSKVGKAILEKDQYKATEEKAIIEQAQRDAVKKRAAEGIVWHPNLFAKDKSTGVWTYKYLNNKRWDPTNEVEEYEYNGVIRSIKVHNEEELENSEHEVTEEDSSDGEKDEDNDHHHHNNNTNNNNNNTNPPVESNQYQKLEKKSC